MELSIDAGDVTLPATPDTPPDGPVRISPDDTGALLDWVGARLTRPAATRARR